MVEEKKEPEVQKVKFKTLQAPAIGRIVLVRMNDGSDRAMLITKVWNPATINGTIFLDGWNDRGMAVPGVREGSLLAHATSLTRGSEANQWRFYDE